MPTYVPPFAWLSYSMLCSAVTDSIVLTSHLIARRASVASDTRAFSLVRLDDHADVPHPRHGGRDEVYGVAILVDALGWHYVSEDIASFMTPDDEALLQGALISCCAESSFSFFILRELQVCSSLKSRRGDVEVVDSDSGYEVGPASVSPALLAEPPAHRTVFTP